MSRITIKIENGFYAMYSPKDQRLIDELKAAIHYAKRKWNGKAWIVEPSAINSLLLAIERAGHERPDVPKFEAGGLIRSITVETFNVEYIGQCKERDNGAVSALATTNAQKPWYGDDGRARYNWTVEFLESALKEFFNRPNAQATDRQTHYQILCVFESATDQEIKAAHRRLARQWHPDVCREPEASEMFKAIQEAYELLRDPQQRKRYDAGLFFEREALKPAPEQDDTWIYYGRKRRKFENKYFRAPLRCGLITCEGIPGMQRFTVSKIVDWKDIVQCGQVMTSSWNKYTESIEVQWL